MTSKKNYRNIFRKSTKISITKINPEKKVAFPSLIEVWNKRELLMVMSRSAIKGRYRQSLLGVAWGILNPLVNMLVFTMIFSRLARVSTGETPYELFVIAALLPWQFFSRVTLDSTNSLVLSSSIISKVYIPSVIVLLAPIGPALVDFFVGILVLVGMFIYYGYSPDIISIIVMLPFYLILSAMLAIAIGLWISVINVTFRDVSVVLPVLMQVWFFLSPIVYPVSMVPPQYQIIYSLNPIYVIAEGFRSIFLGTTPPDLWHIVITILITMSIALPGLVVFNKLSRNMVDKI
jgi:lipopolysaccharide transport system permease protein